LVLVWFAKNDSALRRTGPECIIVMLLAIVVRMLVPFEFPFTYSIRIEKIQPELRQILRYVIIERPFEYTVWSLMCFVWGVGIVGIFIYKLISYRKILRHIALYKGQNWDEFCNRYRLDVGAYKEVCKDIDDIKLVMCKDFKAPFVIGLKNPCLILPEIMYEERQLHYVILHEMIHIQKKDVAWKILVDLLCAVFWWNPVFWYVKKELFSLIEMRNDVRIVSSFSEEKQIEYMECLKNTAVQLAGKDIAFGVSFSRNNFKELKRRLKLVAGKDKYCCWQQVALCTLTCLCLILSTTIIFEPYKLPTEDGVEIVPLTASNTYLIINQEQYDVYVDGMYLFTTDDLTPFQGVNIYQNIEEAIKNEEKRND